MKMSRVLSMLFVAILLISVVPVMAQTDTEYVVTFGDGVTVYYPEGWSATTDEEDATVLASESSALYVYLYSLSDLEENSLEPGDVTGTLEAFHTYNMGDQTEAFDANKLVTVTVNDREITYFEPLEVGENEQYHRLRGAMVLDETGRIVVFGAYPFEGDAVTDLEAILEIVSTAETGAYYLGDGTVFYYPPTWDSYIDDDGYLRLDSDTIDILMYFYSPEKLVELKANADNLIPVLEDAFLAANDKSLMFDPANVTTFAAGDYPGVEYMFTDTYEGESYERWLLVTLSPDSWANMFDVVPVETTLTEEDKATVLDILASFELPAE